MTTGSLTLERTKAPDCVEKKWQKNMQTSVCTSNFYENGNGPSNHQAVWIWALESQDFTKFICVASTTEEFGGTLPDCIKGSLIRSLRAVVGITIWVLARSIC